jgi:TatA/E family protein of Tat protein translocase
MPELILILLVALLVLGPKRLPEVARALGRSMAEFRRASTELRNTLSASVEEREPAPKREPRADRASQEKTLDESGVPGAHAKEDRTADR